MKHAGYYLAGPYFPGDVEPPDSGGRRACLNILKSMGAGVPPTFDIHTLPATLTEQVVKAAETQTPYQRRQQAAKLIALGHAVRKAGEVVADPATQAAITAQQTTGQTPPSQTGNNPTPAGVVTLAELKDAGLSASAVAKIVAAAGGQIQLYVADLAKLLSPADFAKVGAALAARPAQGAGAVTKGRIAKSRGAMSVAELRADPAVRDYLRRLRADPDVRAGRAPK